MRAIKSERSMIWFLNNNLSWLFPLLSSVICQLSRTSPPTEISSSTARLQRIGAHDYTYLVHFLWAIHSFFWLKIWNRHLHRGQYFHGILLNFTCLQIFCLLLANQSKASHRMLHNPANRTKEQKINKINSKPHFMICLIVKFIHERFINSQTSSQRERVCSWDDRS